MGGQGDMDMRFWGVEAEVKYDEFIKTKAVRAAPRGHEPSYLPDFLKPFQRHLVEWNVRTGSCATWADCGLGKGPMAMVAGLNAVEATGRPSLIVAPLAVSRQFVREAKKFGLEINHTQDGTVKPGLNVANYERLENYNPDDLGRVDLDEAGILKNFDGHYRKLITHFMHGVRFRGLYSATPAPNDYVEFGGSCQALGVMTKNQMLGTFFTHAGKETQGWELKPHARGRFWQWMSSWSRAVRKPSDLGDFSDEGYDLPPLKVQKHYVPGAMKHRGMRGMSRPVTRSLQDQQEENRRTLEARCKLAAELVPRNRQCIVWCHLNREADMLERLIPGAVQVAGRDTDSHKEKAMLGFADGAVRVLITKPKIAGHGMNWQNCDRVIYFASHSHEAYYQAVRRCWRFGQAHPVEVSLIASQANSPVVDNMLRKEKLSDALYQGIVEQMTRPETKPHTARERMLLPLWLR